MLSLHVVRQGDIVADVKVSARLTINNSAAILAMVESGGGIGLILDFTARAALDAKNVQLILPESKSSEPYTGSVHLVYARPKPCSKGADGHRLSGVMIFAGLALRTLKVRRYCAGDWPVNLLNSVLKVATSR